MDVLDWGNDPSKGVTVKMRAMQPPWTQERMPAFSKEHTPWEKIIVETCLSPSGTPALLFQALLITFVQMAER